MNFDKKLQKTQKKQAQVQQSKDQKKEQKINKVKANLPKETQMLQKKSKKIKKLQTPIAQVPKKAIQTPYKLDYNEFYNQRTLSLQKIKQRTIQKLILDKNLIKTASKSLKNYYNLKNEKKNDLLDNHDDFIYLEINLAKLPEKYSIRPIQIPLPVPIYNDDLNSRFCVFSSDPQREYKDKIKDLNIPEIAKVIGYSKISKKFPTYKEKRQLFYSYDLFFCDYKIYDILKKPTGKIFYERKKIPFPIDCQNVPKFIQEQKQISTYEDYLNDLKNYTYFQMGNGPAYTLKIARVNFSTKDIVKNIINAIYDTIPHLLLNSNVKHNNIRSISIKTFNSISLPIFNQLSSNELESLHQ